MNNLQVFQNEEFGSIRIVEIDGEPWLVGKDVAEALGYGEGKSLANAVARHVDPEDKGVTEMMTPGGRQEMTILNESGLYSLVLSSKLPTARKFRRWVTSEVIPSIRKHGAYLTPETLEAAILNPDTMIRLCTALKDEQDKRRALEAANAALTVDKQIMQPKAEYFDALVSRNLLTNFRDTAKALGIRQNAFVRFLLDRKYLYRDPRGRLMPYAQYVNDGLFQMKEQLNETTNWAGTQTLITPKGRETFRLLCIG